MKWFYCGKLSTAGILVVNQRGVSRITKEMCEARCDNGKCPAHHKDPKECLIYKREVLNDINKKEVR